MSRLESLTLAVTAAVIVLVVFLIPKRGASFSDHRCPPMDFESISSFVFKKTEGGSVSRYVLHTRAGEFPSYLLIRESIPGIEGLSLPALIRSDDTRRYQTQVSSSGRIRLKTQTAYAVLRDGMDNKRPYEVLFPVAASGLTITQADGQVDDGEPTHLDSLGLTHAVDIAGRMGSKVVAAKGGIVVFTESRSPDGACQDARMRNRPDNQVVILHDDGTEAVYGHLKQHSIRVRVGDRVKSGHPIAVIGKSGWTPGSHLHFQVGGLTEAGYRTLPLVFRCVNGQQISPIPNGPVCLFQP